EAPACPGGVSEAWSCDGNDRVRCQWGEVTRESCEHGCSAGECQSAPVDMDGDGAVASVDCDDMDPSIHPGAVEVCEDGIDQNCDGIDLPCGAIIGVDGGDGAIDADGGVAYGGGGTLTGGCSAAPGPRSAGVLGLLALAALALIRRRR